MAHKREISVFWSDKDDCWVARSTGFARQGCGDTPADAIAELQSITDTITDFEYRRYLTKDNERLQRQNAKLQAALAEIRSRTKVMASSGPMELWHIHTISHDALKDNS